MVEYNKYDDLKEQQLISNLIDTVTIAEQTHQINRNDDKYGICGYYIENELLSITHFSLFRIFKL